MIYFECSDKVMEERLLSRGKTSGRADDNESTIKKRLEVFNKETKAILKMLDKPGFEIKVNADHGVEEVFTELKQKLVDAGYKPLAA
jgi:UMP-CMP kinase